HSFTVTEWSERIPPAPCRDDPTSANHLPPRQALGGGRGHGGCRRRVRGRCVARQRVSRAGAPDLTRSKGCRPADSCTYRNGPAGSASNALTPKSGMVGRKVSGFCPVRPGIPITLPGSCAAGGAVCAPRRAARSGLATRLLHGLGAHAI